MIGIGKVLLGAFNFGIIFILISCVSGILVYRRMREELRET